MFKICKRYDFLRYESQLFHDMLKLFSLFSPKVMCETRKKGKDRDCQRRKRGEKQDTDRERKVE